MTTPVNNELPGYQTRSKTKAQQEEAHGTNSPQNSQSDSSPSSDSETEESSEELNFPQDILHQQEENILEEIEDSQQDNTMADNEYTNSLLPPVFEASSCKDAARWIRLFNNFATTKGLTDAKYIGALYNRLSQEAQDWFDQLPDEGKDTKEHLEASFTDRFGKSDIAKCFEIKDLFARQQKTAESTDAYIDTMSKNSQDLAIAPEIVLQAVKAGLKAQIRTQILAQNPGSLEAIRKLARQVEDPNTQTPEATNLTAAVAAITHEIREVLTPLITRVNNIRTPPRMPSPAAQRNNLQPARDYPPRQVQFEEYNRQPCRNCGSGRCNYISCRARGQTCNYCNKLNHFKKVCYSFARDQANQNRASPGRDFNPRGPPPPRGYQGGNNRSRGYSPRQFDSSPREYQYPTNQWNPPRRSNNGAHQYRNYSPARAYPPRGSPPNVASYSPGRNQPFDSANRVEQPQQNDYQDPPEVNATG
jgi:hypothetical protein